MLVLSRKSNESIILEVPGYDPIKITVVRSDPSKVRLGIEANKDITILRSEVPNKNSVQNFTQANR